MPYESGPKLHFEYEFDDRAAFEANSRGYLSHVSVELDDGSRYPVVFYDPIRLQQDVEEEAVHGNPFVAEPGMIVLAEITMENMKKSIAKLAQEGFFSRFSKIENEIN